MPSLGRKLLMAGRGGLNLTHSEPPAQFLARYGAASEWLRPMIEAFPPEALVSWCNQTGQATFTGSSGRIFPVAMKASPLLRAWLRRLADNGVSFKTRHRWTGWDDTGAALFESPEGLISVHADITILTCGGATWPRLGSDAAWVEHLPNAVAPFRPSNCGFTVDWSAYFRSRFAGHPLKRIAIRFAGAMVRGEAMLTEPGIEGGAIYALSARLRDAIASDGSATVRIDLRPDIDAAALSQRVGGPRGSQSLSNVLRKQAGLSPEAIGLLQEALHTGADATDLAALIKAVPVRLTGTAPMERAISSAGGLRRDALDDRLMLRDRPGVFAAGEMLDWEAPTGGYLLQACFSTGVAAANGALAWLAERG